METKSQLSLQVVELLHYCQDVDASTAFYTDRLGWGLIWQAPGNLAVLDAGGAYQVVLIAAKWVPGWGEGHPVPAPRLSLQSQNLAADLRILRERGLPEIELQGDPKDMLFANIPFVENKQFFAWQDGQAASATKSVEDYRARGGGSQLYSLGECVFFMDDIGAALGYLMEKFGFRVKEQHGEVFTALQIGDGPVVGLFDMPTLLKQPVFSPGTVRTRLFLECPDIQAEHARQAASGAKPGELHSEADGLGWFSTADPDGTAMTFWQFSPPVD